VGDTNRRRAEMTLVDYSPHKDEEEFDFAASAREWMRKHEVEWTNAGERYAWVDQEPTWVSACDWDVYVFQMENLPEKLVNRFYRFTLIGGGQLTVIERYVWSNIHHSDADPAPSPAWLARTR
jgi:hypothetical protein